MYTTITARCVDQTLTVTSIPKIASGGENEVRIDVTFDSRWNGFGKTAVFYRDPKKVYHVVMVNDTCLIPREVLTEAGRVYFGVMGTSGATTRTTEVVALAVAQGAITGAINEPLPDVYRQLLGAYGEATKDLAVERARIDNLVAGGTVGDAEVLDIRVGADGTTYKSAGEAVRGQIANATIPKMLDVNKWVQTPLEKQPFMYWELLNGPDIIEQVELSASYICGAGSVSSLGTLAAYVMKRGRLLNDIPLTASVDDYTVVAYSPVAFTGNVYLMYSDFSGNHPYMITTGASFRKGWNVVAFEGAQAGATPDNDLTHGYRFLAVRPVPTSQATLELLNGLQFCLVQGLTAVLDAWSPPSTTTHDIVAWGDSLTQGSGGSGTTYVGVVANALGATYYNGGQGGENPSLIACRAGANTFYIPAGQDPQAPFAGVFDSGGGSLATSSETATIPAQVGGVLCTVSRNAAGMYTVSGLTAANYPRPVVLEQQHNKGKVTIIWVGTNSGRTYEELHPWIDRIAETAPNKNVIVLGLTYHTDVEALARTNTQLRERYGNKFLDIRERLLNHGLARAGVPATQNDVEAIASGKMPPSLLSDNVHFNATGYRAIGEFVLDKMRALGYDILVKR